MTHRQASGGMEGGQAGRTVPFGRRPASSDSLVSAFRRDGFSTVWPPAKARGGPPVLASKRILGGPRKEKPSLFRTSFRQ
mgnify:CR=1 FL=1|jgi:hypothetical protein